MPTMAEERSEPTQKPGRRHRGLRFADVRDRTTGQLLFRVSRTGVLEIKVRGEFLLIDLWQFISEEEQGE